MIRFLRLFLAVFRVTILFKYDDQPVIKWLRDDWSIFRPFWRDLLRCHRCLSVWGAIFVLIVDRFKLTGWIVDLFALSGLEVLVHDLVWKNKK